MTTQQDPDWKALCVAYVKAYEAWHGEDIDLDTASDMLDDAIEAMRAAVKAHGDA